MTACTGTNPLYSRLSDGGSAPDSAPGGSGGAPFGTGGFPFGTGGVPLGTGGFPFGTGGVPVGTGGVPLGTGGVPLGTGGGPGTGGATGVGGDSGTGGAPVGTGGIGGTDALNPPADLGSETAADTGPVVVGPPPAMCGSTANDLAAITGARGLAIGKDGTVYFTRESGTQAWIGRVSPSGTIESSWLPLPNNAQPRALRLDTSRDYLFIAGFGTNFLYTAATAGAIVNTAAGLTGVHGLAVSDDGGVYVSLATGHIVRLQIELATARMQVSLAAVVPAGQRPLGLAFGPGDRHLYIGSSNGPIRRFELRDQFLYDGIDYGAFTGAANDLALDIHGRLYVAGGTSASPRQLTIIPPGGMGSSTSMGTTGVLGGLAFGRGSIDCQALFVSDAQGPVRRVTALGLGLAIP